VADGSRRDRLPHAPEVGATVIAGLYESECAVGRHAGEGVGEVVADVAGRVGQHLRLPHATRVVQDGLVEERQVLGPHHGPAAGHADATNRRVVEGEQGLRCDLGDRELADAEDGLDLLGRGRLADGDDLGVRVRARLQTEGARDAGRTGHPGLHDVTEVLARDAFDQLGQHPVGRRGVVLEPRARLPVEVPAGERRTPTLARVAGRDEHRGVGEAGGVQHHLLQGDDVLAIGRELGDQLGHPLAGVEEAVPHEGPHGPGDEGLRGRVHDVAGGGRGVAVGLREDDLTVERESQLARGQQAVIDLAAGPGEKGVDGALVQRGHAVLLRLCCCRGFEMSGSL
jgi:hypothetical protein